MISTRQRSGPAVPSLVLPATEKPSAVRDQGQLYRRLFFLQQKNCQLSDISASGTVNSCNRKTVGRQTSVTTELSFVLSATEKSSAVRHQNCRLLSLQQRSAWYCYQFQLHRCFFYLQQKNCRLSDIIASWTVELNCPSFFLNRKIFGRQTSEPTTPSIVLPAIERSAWFRYQFQLHGCLVLLQQKECRTSDTIKSCTVVWSCCNRKIVGPQIPLRAVQCCSSCNRKAVGPLIPLRAVQCCSSCNRKIIVVQISVSALPSIVLPTTERRWNRLIAARLKSIFAQNCIIIYRHEYFVWLIGMNAVHSGNSSCSVMLFDTSKAQPIKSTSSNLFGPCWSVKKNCLNMLRLLWMVSWLDWLQSFSWYKFVLQVLFS